MTHGHPLTQDPLARHPLPVRQASLREHNLALVLRQVAADPAGGSIPHARRAVSRADIAHVTGLTRATVSTLVDDLIYGHLLREVAPAPRGRAGRPSVGLALDPLGPAGLGLEVNVDYLAACVVDLTGAVRHREVLHADQRPHGARDVLASLERLARSTVEAARTMDLRMAGAALALPGLVQGRTVRFAPNLGWRDVEIPEEIADIPVAVDNEANLAAMGELLTNPQVGRDFLYVSGEIGIGAGVVVGGELLRGARGFSGEIGHVAVHLNGPVCHCGAFGCLERYAGQEAIARAAGITAHPHARGDRPGTAVINGPVLTAPLLTAADIAASARAGDRRALNALEAAGTALGIVLAGMVSLIDVDTIVLGGIYTRLEPWLHNSIARELADRVLAADWAPVVIRPSVLAEDAAMVGAATSVVRTIWDHPADWIPAR